jgi:hypothetical protein
LSRHVAPFAALGVEFPLLRPRFWVENLGQIYRAAPVVPRAALGIEVHFW